MAIKTIAELKAKFEAGDVPSAQDFIDLLDTLYSEGNFPNPLPAVSGAALTDITFPNPLPSLDASRLYNINPSEWTVMAAAPNFASSTSFVQTGDQTASLKAQRRLRLKVAGVYVYSEVRSASYNAGSDITTCLTLDAVLAAELTEVAHSVFTPANADGAISAKMVGAINDFLPSETSPASMSVRVGPGSLQQDNATLLTLAAQTTAPLVAPTANPRNDLLVIDELTGVLTAITGTEAASPADPAISAGKIIIFRVRLRVGMVSVTNSDLDDLRTALRPLRADPASMRAGTLYEGVSVPLLPELHVRRWTARTSAVDNFWTGIAWSPELGLFAAVAGTGTGNRVMTSPNGITWTARTSAADNVWISIAWSPELGLFAAVANTGTGNRVMTSPDGITWTARTSAADNSWRGIAWSPELGLFAAVAYTGTGNRVMTSPDGITWTARTSAADNDWYSIAWSPELGLFAAVGGGGIGNRVMTSPDGITWTARTSAADNDWYSIAWSPELALFAAVATSGTGNRVMTSPDGITWTARTSAADNSWRSIAWSPELGLFAAVAGAGTGNRVMTSPNGITWTARTSAADNDWYSIAWSPELALFAAVAASGTGNRVMTSL